MKFIVNEIRNKAHTTPYLFEGKVDVSELVSLNNDIKKMDTVQVKGTCVVDADELIFTYTIDGIMVLPCARTLVDVDYPLHVQVTDVFTTDLAPTEESDVLIYQITGDVLDLRPYIIENIIIETPYRVFSDEKVLEEGQGWAYFTEESLQEQNAGKVDPRLSKLSELFNTNNDETKNK